MRLPQVSRAKFWALLLALTAGVWQGSAAQATGSASVSGRVTGPGGGTAPNALVWIENTATGERVQSRSDHMGRFQFSAVTPGSYTLQVRVAGLSDWEADHLTVGMGTAAGFDVRLASLAVHRTVLLEAASAAAASGTDQPENGREGDSDALQELPSNGRQWSSLAGLLAGGNPGPDGQLSFRGLSPLMNSFLLDGLSNKLAFHARERGTGDAGNGFAVTQSAVGTFQAGSSVGSMSGRGSGAGLAAMTRGGTRRMRSQVVFYDRGVFGQAMNAYSKVMVQVPAGTTGIATGPVFYLDGNPITYVSQPFHAPDRRQQWEVTAGGPLRTGRVWWFFSWGEHLRADPAVARSNEPEVFFAPPADGTLSTLQARLASSMNPLVKACPAWSATSTATAECAYATILHELSGLLGTVPRSSHQTTVFPKVTWRVDRGNTVMFDYNRMRRTAPYGLLQGATETDGIGSFGATATSDDVAAAKWDHSITARLVSSARAEVSRDVLAHLPGRATQFETQFAANASSLPPEISLDTSRGFSFGTLPTSDERRYPGEVRWQFAEAVTWIRGRHAVQSGYSFDHVGDTIEGLNGENGAYRYASLADFAADMLAPNSCDGTTTGKGSDACYSQFRQTLGSPRWDFQTADYAAYAADEYRLRRLALTAGVRYEYDRLPNPNAALVNQAIPETARLPHERNDFGPRIGLSWDIFGRGRTTLRAGFSLFYGRVPNATVFSALNGTGSARAPRTYRWRPTDVGAPVFPSVFASDAIPYQDASAPDQRTTAPEAVYFDRRYRRPQVDQMEISLQQSAGRRTVVTLTGMFTNAHDLAQFVDTNIDLSAVAKIFYTIAAPGAGDSAGPLARFGSHVPGYTNVVYAPQRFYFQRLNPAYGPITDIVSETNSSYRAAEVRVVRRMSRGVTINAGYTWAHAMDDGQNAATFAQRDGLYDPADWRLEHGTSNYDVRQRVAGGLVLREPWRPGGAMGGLFGGYSLAAIGDWRTGLPYTMRTAGSAPAPSCSYTAWLQAGGASGGSKCLESVTQPNGVILAVGVPVVSLGPTLNGSGGEDLIPVIGRNTYRFPVSADLDLRLTKRIQLSDRYAFSVMAEAYNALNHRNVTSMETTGYRLTNDAAHANMATLTWQSGMKPGTETVMTNGITEKQYVFDPTAAFGGVTNANSLPTGRERQLQLGLKLDF